jgi:hypothetical protein
MGGLEVVIDGVSLELPRNPYRAVFALLTIMGEELSASVHGVRPIEFSAFDLGTEVISFNESLKIFLEQVS